MEDELREKFKDLQTEVITLGCFIWGLMVVGVL